MSTKVFCPQCDVFIASQMQCHECGWLRPIKVAQPTLQWQAEVGGKAISLLAISGLVCLATTDGEILALRERDGRVTWKSELNNAIVSGRMATWNRLLIIGLQHSGMPEPQSVLALDLKSGKLVWRFSASALALSSPLVADDIVYFTSSEGYLFAIRAADGELVWKSDKIGSNWSPAAPAIGSGRVFIGTEDRFVLAFDAQTGKRSWTFTGDSDTCFSASPTWAKQTLFVASRDGSLYALNAQDGHKKWNLDLESRLTSSPTVAKYEVLVGSRDGHLYAVDGATGKGLWEFKAERWIYAAPTIDSVNRVVYCTSRDHRIYALELETGREMWRFESRRRILVSPLLTNGKVIFASFDRHVYALQAYQTETRLSAEAYEQRKLYLDAAVEYALRKNLRKAVRLFEQEQEWVKAAAIWNCIGNERQAARCYERGGKLESAYAIHQRLNDVVSAVKLAIRLGRHGEAASFSLQLGQSGKAAEQFALSGDLSQAAKLYKEIKDWANALRIYKKLGDRMQQAEMLIELERMSEAAILLEGEDKPTRAAQVYEAAGEVHKAALLYSQLQEWQKARDLFETLGEWERAAEVCVHLDDDRQTADAYKKAAEAAENSHPLDLEHIASLWESAADSYQQAAARRREAACRHKVSQYKKLPYISLQISTDKRFFVGESDALPVILVNAGGGPAYDIVIQSTTKVGKVESGESKLQGLEAGCSEQLTLPILSETPGRVRLNFQVSFSDAQQHDYTIKEHAYIEVKGKKSQRYAHLDFSIGLERLNQLVAEKQHQVRKDHATLEARLLANLTDENKSGSTETTRVERTRIMDALNDFVLEYFGITFTSLCQGE